MAAIVLRRKAGLTEFSDAFVQSPECQEMQTKVRAELDPEIVEMGKGVIVARITLTTKDGRTYFEQSDPHYRGGPKNPLTYEEVSDKFRDAAAGVLSEEKMEAFLRLARDFETLPGLGDIMDTVCA
jgi:2-methylcitrate dehydratase PrpD